MFDFSIVLIYHKRKIMSIQKLILEYLEYLEIERNRSSKTVENYLRYLKRFAKFSKIKTPSQITAEMVRQYRIWLNRQQFKKNTQNYHIIALRNFLKYLAKRDIKVLSAEKIELGRQTDREVVFLQTEELDRLLQAPNNLRDKAILEVLFSTGLRVSELVNLNREDINLLKAEFYVRGKGGKIRPVFLSETAQKALKYYLESRKDTEQALLINQTDNQRLTTRSIQRIVRRWAVKAGLTKRITPHTLRHSLATDLLAGGADLRSIQGILGHSSITTTQIYTHITDQRLKEVHQKYHRRSKFVH